MTDSPIRWQGTALALLLAMAPILCLPAAAQGRGSVRSGDYIAAVVNQELVTAGEVQRRVERAFAEAGRSGARLPPESDLRRQVLDALIDERVIITSARESGVRVDEPEIDRAVQSIAAQNQISMDMLRQRLAAEGMDYGRFRATLRDQMMIERMREREVYRRIQISDEEVDKIIQAQRAAVNADAETNLAQILVTVPEGADEATVAARRARIMAALERVRAGEAFDAVAREVSEDGNRAERRRDRVATRIAAARRLRRSHARAATGRGERRTAAHRCRLPPPEGARAQGAAAGPGDADARPPRAAAHLAAAQRRGGGAAAGGVPAPDRERREDLRGHRAAVQRGRLRRGRR